MFYTVEIHRMLLVIVMYNSTVIRVENNKPNKIVPITEENVYKLKPFHHL